MTAFQGEVYIDNLDTTEQEWTPVEMRALATALCQTIVQKALAMVVREASEAVFQFRGLDLTTQAGVADGIKLQGRSDGMLGVVQRLCDLAEEGNEDGK